MARRTCQISFDCHLGPGAILTQLGNQHDGNIRRHKQKNCFMSSYVDRNNIELFSSVYVKSIYAEYLAQLPLVRVQILSPQTGALGGAEAVSRSIAILSRVSMLKLSIHKPKLLASPAVTSSKYLHVKISGLQPEISSVLQSILLHVWYGSLLRYADNSLFFPLLTMVRSEG